MYIQGSRGSKADAAATRATEEDDLPTQNGTKLQQTELQNARVEATKSLAHFEVMKGLASVVHIPILRVPL